MGVHSTTAANSPALLRPDAGEPGWLNAAGLVVWLAAGAAAFLPFAYATSAWDAVRFHVPGNQGNWWHFLAGAPIFLAFPMIWLRLRLMFSNRLSTQAERRFIWVASGLSTLGTISVETPFLLHLAGTSQWQRLVVLSLGFGIIVVSVLILLLRRHQFSPTRACIAALNTAYLANAALCLIVYSDAPGSVISKSGWFLTMAVVWPIALEQAGLLVSAMQTPAL